MRWEQVEGKVGQLTGWNSLPVRVKRSCEALFRLLASHQPAYHVYQDCLELLLDDWTHILEDVENKVYHAEFEWTFRTLTWILTMEIGEQATSSVWVRPAGC